MTIYFIEAETTGFIKIGFTSGTVVRRVAQLQTGQPLKLKLLGTIPGDKDAESGLHREFAEYRKNGEWFSPAPEMITAINSLIKNQLPWFHCREGKILWNRLDSQWKELFGATDDTAAVENVCGFSDQELKKTVRQIQSFKEAAARVKKNPNRIHRRRIYQWYATFKNAPEIGVAKYLLNWEEQ